MGSGAHLWLQLGQLFMWAPSLYGHLWLQLGQLFALTRLSLVLLYAARRATARVGREQPKRRGRGAREPQPHHHQFTDEHRAQPQHKRRAQPQHQCRAQPQHRRGRSRVSLLSAPRSCAAERCRSRAKTILLMRTAAPGIVTAVAAAKGGGRAACQTPAVGKGGGRAACQSPAEAKGGGTSRRSGRAR